MSKVCVHCGKPTKKKPRCVACGYADPSRRAKIAEAKRQWWAKRLADPAGRKEAIESAKRLTRDHPPTRERIERQVAGRAKTTAAGCNPHVWIPPVGYEALDDVLRRKKFSKVDRKRIIGEQIAADERARLAAMTPFERQLDKVRNGAALIERHPMPSRVHDYSLTGSSMSD